MRIQIESTFHTIVMGLVDNPAKQKAIVSEPAVPNNLHCYRQSVTKFRRGCGNIGMVFVLTVLIFKLLWGH